MNTSMNTSMNTPSNERLALEDTIIQKITDSPYIQGELFTYISTKGLPCTKNENGIFLNISAMSEDTLSEIHTMIHHIETYNKSVVDKELLLSQIASDTPPQEPESTKKTYTPFHLSGFQRRLLNLISS